MTYFDWPKTSLYNASTSGDYDVCLSQALASDQVDIDVPKTSLYDWRVCRPGQYYDYDDVDLWPTSLGPEANLESTTSGVSYEAQIQRYDQWLYPEHFWPATEQYAQPDFSTALNCDNFFASAAASETSELAPAPSSNWESNSDGKFTETLHIRPRSSCQPSVGSTRIKSTKKHRHQPYIAVRPYSNEHTNAKAGPSNPAAPCVPYVALPPANPSGGTSADAETTYTNTEEYEAPTKRPRGARKPRPGRILYQEHIKRLCDWAERWGKPKKFPSHREALDIALVAIKMLYPVPASNEHSLSKRDDGQKGQNERNIEAVRESRRRNGIRVLNEEISKFYELPEGELAWACPKLLSRVLRDIEPLLEPLTTQSA